MIECVTSKTKTIQLDVRIGRIEFYKHETGNIDIYRVYDKDDRLLAYEGFFRGSYSKVEHLKEVETTQLSIFDYEGGRYEKL